MDKKQEIALFFLVQVCKICKSNFNHKVIKILSFIKIILYEDIIFHLFLNMFL